VGKKPKRRGSKGGRKRPGPGASSKRRGPKGKNGQKKKSKQKSDGEGATGGRSRNYRSQGEKKDETSASGFARPRVPRGGKSPKGQLVTPGPATGPSRGILSG